MGRHAAIAGYSAASHELCRSGDGASPIAEATIPDALAPEEIMAAPSSLSIVILYCHALLGEGIGRLLASEPGASVTYIACSDPDCVTQAVAARPSVVLVERCGAFDALQVVAVFPDALVIDFAIGPGPTWAYRRQEIPGNPAAIVDLVRRMRQGHPDIPLPSIPHPEDELVVSSS